MKDSLKPTEARSGPIEGRALVIDQDEQQSRGIVRALRAVVDQVCTYGSTSEAANEVDWDLIVVNYDGLDEAARSRILEHFAEQNENRRLIVCSSEYGYEHLGELLGEHGVSHAMASGNLADLESLRITACKSLDHDIFGIDKYLAWGALRSSMTIASSAQRPDVLAACSKLAARVGMRARRADSLATLTDELVTNALYNAPTNPDGKHRFEGVERSTEIALQPGEGIVVEFGADVENVAVSVSDPFGSVTCRHLARCLGQCLANEQREPQRNQGGAGLGLFHAYQASSHLAFNIAPGQRTEAIGILNIASSNREFKTRPKSLNMFQSDFRELSGSSHPAPNDD